ncbi:DUF1659 domain-containing protein [Bacillus timonensis]|uniref:DUF1659 domain-containing protein n=1 Tax=Bacillus timonensis TaxID=1033734 RepID=UPI000289F109|nr:DUF1659 domain-containing protein [Bacillus timonensis]
MAAYQDIQDTQLRLVFETGVDEKGKVIYKNKNYNNINPSATADQLYSVAVAIEKLQSLQLFNIERNDSYMLAGDGE